MKPCMFCGEPVDPKVAAYIGSQAVYVCDAAECDRDLVDASRAAEDEARMDAEEDGYGRYMP